MRISVDAQDHVETPQKRRPNAEGPERSPLCHARPRASAALSHALHGIAALVGVARPHDFDHNRNVAVEHVVQLHGI